MSKAMIRSVSLLALAGMFWASAAHAQVSESDMLMRIDQLQAQVRDLTGTVEELQHRNQQLQQQLQQMQQGPGGAANTAQARPGPQYAPAPQAQQQYSPPQYPASPNQQYSNPQYSAPAATAQYSPPQPYTPSSEPQYSPAPPQYPPPNAPLSAPGTIAAAEPAGQPPDQAASPGRHGDAFDPSANPNAPGAPRRLGAPGVAAAEPPPAVYNTPAPRQPGAPLDLSSSPDDGQSNQQGGPLPPPPPISPNSTGAMQASLPPGNTPKDEFDLGYGYVLHKDYGPAEQTLRDFLQKYPSDRLTPEAQYWLGEALFQDKHYREAAESFLAVSTKYETTARAPEALMRLGQSLASLGEKEAACASLGEVLRKYPKASPAVKQNVDREQKRAHC
jgi:tol-pal system protein YbgF